MADRTCTRCGVPKPEDDFPADRRRPAGFQSWCRACKAEAQRRRYASDPASEIAAAYLRAVGHPEARRATRQRWRERHPDHRDNPDTTRRRKQRWDAANKAGRTEHTRRRRARLRGATVAMPGAELVALKMAYWGHRCWMCGGPFENVDHVKPVARGGSHLLCNLRPACGKCNRIKSSKWPWPTGRPPRR